MVIEVAGRDDQAKDNYLPTMLSRAARLYLINLPENMVQTCDKLCAMFIENFQGTYEQPTIVETLKTIKEKPDENFCDYVKQFCNTRNSIPHIQDIEITSAFCDRATDLKTVEEITMKKPKIVAYLFTIADECIKALEA
jgi:hypothetical protein